MDRVETRLLTLGYVSALTLLAALLGLTHYYSREVIQSQASDGHVINLAGRQRMLSQRMAKQMLLMGGSNRDAAHHGQQLRDSLRTWTRVHRGLQDGDRNLRLPGHNSSEVTSLFGSMAPHYDSILQGHRRILARAKRSTVTRDQADVQQVLRASQSYLSWMDRIVFQYDREARERVAQLERRETTALVAALTLLGLEALLIFRPLVIRIRRSRQQLQHANDELARDVARRMRVEAEREQLATVKDEFLRIASHDLKAPLTIILGAGSVIHEAIPPGKEMSESCHTLLGRIVANGQVMKQIVEDFLDFQALEDGKVKLQVVTVDPADLIQEVMDRMSEYASSRNVKLIMTVDPQVDQCCMDQNRVGQVMANLMHNAIKFSPDGGSVEVRLSNSEDRLEVTVSDEGPGLRPEDMPKVFDKYTQLGNKPEVSEKSSGLGLAICKQLVQLHDGEIGVRNNKSRGATFWFTLPQAPEGCCQSLRG